MIIKGDEANDFVASMMIGSSKTLREARKGVVKDSPMDQAICRLWKGRGK